MTPLFFPIRIKVRFFVHVDVDVRFDIFSDSFTLLMRTRRLDSIDRTAFADASLAIPLSTSFTST